MENVISLKDIEQKLQELEFKLSQLENLKFSEFNMQIINNNTFFNKQQNHQQQ